MIKLRVLATSLALLSATGPVLGAAPAGIVAATGAGRIGLLPAASFRVTSGQCDACPTVKQALWYFKHDVLAVPPQGQSMSGFTPGLDAVADVRQWAASPEATSLAHPGLVWLGSPQLLDNVTLLPGARQVRAVDGAIGDLMLVPKIPSNLSYWDAKTSAFFEKRPLRMRGEIKQVGATDAFVARTVWPKDFVLDPARVEAKPLGAQESLRSFVQERGGSASEPYSTRLLWERTPGQARAWQDKPVLAVMLNGAQGDDDEAFGGHFAIATGAIGKQGEWSDWVVNNFYNLDSFSEKGIVSAPVLMDNYLMDLNSGQQYYRPSYMMVAVLANPRTAVAYQGGVQRVFNHFYRHDFTYRHAAANCAGISMDVFKALGWNVPERGATSGLKAIGAWGYLSAKDRSLASGRKIYDYLTEEQTRLYPAVAFEAAGTDLMQLVGAAPGLNRALTPYEQQLQSDVEAIVLVKIPQVPSSRVMGSNPVFSFDEFMKRTPPDQKDWKIVPAGPRPFPAELRDAQTMANASPGPVPLPVAGIGVGGIFLAGALLRRRKARKNAAR